MLQLKAAVMEKTAYAEEVRAGPLRWTLHAYVVAAGGGARGSEVDCCWREGLCCCRERAGRS